MTRRIVTIAAAAMLLLAAAAEAGRQEARPNPKKAEPGACVQMSLSVRQMGDGHFEIQVEVAEECRGDLYANLRIAVDGLEISQASVEGVARFTHEAELGPQTGPFEVCAWLEGELRQRKKATDIYRTECTLAEPIQFNQP